MKPQTTMLSTPPLTRRFGAPICPQCDDLLLAPAISEHVSNRLVRHLWACETCGHAFVTSVRLTSVRTPKRPTTLS